MSIYAPFTSAEEMAKYSFYDIEAIKRKANSTNDYDQQMFLGMIGNAVMHKEYQEDPERVRRERIVSDSIDIRKTWRAASKCERGGNSQVQCGVVMVKRAKVK